jgi:hypothetical protein
MFDEKKRAEPLPAPPALHRSVVLDAPGRRINMKLKLSLAAMLVLVAGNSIVNADILGPNQGLAEYDAGTGIVRVSTNGANFIEVNSVPANLITANAVPLLSVPNALFQDPPTPSKINYGGINALGAGGFLDDFSLGAILPTGLSNLNGLTFRWSNPGVPAQEIPIVPEPSALALIGLAGLPLVRRRRNKA